MFAKKHPVIAGMIFGLTVDFTMVSLGFGSVTIESEVSTATSSQVMPAVEGYNSGVMGTLGYMVINAADGSVHQVPIRCGNYIGDAPFAHHLENAIYQQPSFVIQQQ